MAQMAEAFREGGSQIYRPVEETKPAAE